MRCHSVIRQAAGVLGCGWVLCAAAADEPGPVTFRTDVMAVLSKAGCNAGTCHGNANGKGGFKLSLRGQDPLDDYAALTKVENGRIERENPEASLILLKPTLQKAHEGGERFEKGSRLYEILRAWIAQGAPADDDSPQLESLTVSPMEHWVQLPEKEVQISVQARFSDGSERDVSAMAVYEASNTLVTVDAEGLARTERSGESTVLVRYLQLQAPVRLVFVAERPGFEWEEPEEFNEIDRHIFAKLRRLKMNPSELCTDEEFIRRASLDLLGMLPAMEEARRFVADEMPDKRSRLVARLLGRTEFAEYWALKWADLLRSDERVLDRKGVERLQRWLQGSIRENKPLDQFAREIIVARGSTYENPPANFYRANRTPVSRAETAAQLFLGTRLQCAQCHNHPFDRWTQADYYAWAGAFSRVNYKVLENRRRDSNDSHEFKGEQVVYVAAKGEVKNPRTGKPEAPRLLGESAAVKDGDPLEAIAQWMVAPENPFFARAQVNRIWYHLMGRGIVDPIDDFRPTNPASHPELIEALAREFVESGYDVRQMITRIMHSRTYQLSAVPNATNADDEVNYARVQPRRLEAEPLLDVLGQVTGAEIEHPGYPGGLRAAQMPSAIDERRLARNPAPSELFLDVFGKPARLLSCECERSGETTMNQAFQMISGQLVSRLIGSPENRIARWLDSARASGEIIEEMYWTALTRAPTEEERSVAAALLEGSEKRAALEDLLWALVNSKEFLLRK